MNHAIALQQLERPAEADAALDSLEWDGQVSQEFRMAERILRQDFESAAALMRRVGQEGDFFSEEAYHTWPLFIRFRTSDPFQEAYRDVFGYEFRTKLREQAEEQEEAIEESAAAGPTSDEWGDDLSADTLVEELDGHNEPLAGSRDFSSAPHDRETSATHGATRSGDALAEEDETAGASAG